MAKKYYAVKKGKNPGIYITWDECKEQVNGYSGASFKSFKQKSEAEAFLGIKQPKERKTAKNINYQKQKNLRKKEYETKDRKAIELSHKPNSVSVYTDGSWARDIHGNKMYGGGIVIIEKGQIVKRKTVSGDEAGLAKLRNVAGEMQATVRAIDYIAKNMPHIENINLFVDYNGLIYWAIPESEGGWQRKNPYTQKYGMYLDRMKKRFNINIEHVKGHNNDLFNEEADCLANYSKYLYLEGRMYNELEFLNKYSYFKKANK